MLFVNRRCDYYWKKYINDPENDRAVSSTKVVILMLLYVVLFSKGV